MAVQKKSKAPEAEGKGLSIWLVPSDKAVYGKLSEMIRTIAASFPDPVAKRSPPIVEPHVKLVETITDPLSQASQKTQELAASIKPFDLTFGLLRSAGTEDYFRVVYADVNQTPEIISANDLARRLFGKTDLNYNPRLDLVLGNFSNEIKLEMVKSLFSMKKGIISFSDYNFNVDRLVLYSTNGPVASWYKVGEFGLTG